MELRLMATSSGRYKLEQRILERLILFVKTGAPTWMLTLLQGVQFILSLVGKFGC